MSSSSSTSMHVKADEAVQKLDKIKWANMNADKRLKLLEQIQEQLAEEMEDLGVEEAEMRNIKIGTQDNLFTADACRLSAVIPIAFEISSCIELYKTNIAGKTLNPVEVTRVDNSQVDEINFAKPPPQTPQGPEGMAPPPPAPDASDNAEEELDVDEQGEEINGETTDPGGELKEEEEAGAEERKEEATEEASSTPENGKDSESTEEKPEEVKETEAEEKPEEVKESEEKPENGNDSEEEGNPKEGEGSKSESDKDEAKGDNGDASEECKDEQEVDDENEDSTEDKENGMPHDDDAEEPTNKDKTLETKESDDDVKINVLFPELEGANKDFVPVDPSEIFYDVLVSPRTWNEKGYYNARKDRLRIQGDPQMPDWRMGPYDSRDPKATAILGSGSYSAAPEIIKAAFLDGHVVVYKPHPNNVDTDKIWSEIMRPLVEVGALSYCTHDQGPDLVKHDGIDQIYMIGSGETAQEILKATDKPCILQTGSVNPVIIVPGDRTWGARELRHHALQIATAGKHNGGHFCGRPQVIVTSKLWEQREQFLEELEDALSTRTPPEGSYDPKYRQVFQHFVDMYPQGKVIRQDGVDTSAADVLLVTGCTPKDFYGLQNEAFCQVFMEVCLDVFTHPGTFIPAAVKFCNEDLYGSLCATIVIDDQTSLLYNKVVEKALSDLQYGTVSTNVIACVSWNNPALYWGSYKRCAPNAYFGHFERGAGHFGNLFGCKDACKSIITDNFTGKGHFIKTCRGAYNGKIAALSNYAVDPTWKKLSNYKLKGVRAAAGRKDW